jgi:hypothetical protein
VLDGVAHDLLTSREGSLSGNGRLGQDSIQILDNRFLFGGLHEGGHLDHDSRGVERASSRKGIPESESNGVEGRQLDELVERVEGASRETARLEGVLADLGSLADDVVAQRLVVVVERFVEVEPEWASGLAGERRKNLGHRELHLLAQSRQRLDVGTPRDYDVVLSSGPKWLVDALLREVGLALGIHNNGSSLVDDIGEVHQRELIGEVNSQEAA